MECLTEKEYVCYECKEKFKMITFYVKPYQKFIKGKKEYFCRYNCYEKYRQRKAKEKEEKNK